MPETFHRIARPHPAAIENQKLARCTRLIVLSAIAGLLLSIPASVAIHAIFIRKTATLGDLQLLLPLAVLLVPLFLWKLHRHLSLRPRLRIADDRIDVFPRGLNPLAPARRVDAAGLQAVHLLRDAFGARLLFVRRDAPPVELDLATSAAGALLEWLQRHDVSLHDGASVRPVREWLDALIEPESWTLASDREKLRCAYHFHLPFVFGRILARQELVTQEELERYYRLLRTRADFLFLQEAAADVARCLPGFALPREDRLRIACVLRVRGAVEEALRELEELPEHEEIPESLLKEWKEHLKYRNLPPPPYSGLATRLLSGVSHYARVREGGLLETRDATVPLSTFVAAHLPPSAFSTAPLELHDILGRVARINQDEAATLRDVRRASPHVLRIHAHSYLSLGTRIQLRAIIQNFQKRKRE